MKPSSATRLCLSPEFMYMSFTTFLLCSPFKVKHFHYVPVSLPIYLRIKNLDLACSRYSQLSDLTYNYFYGGKVSIVFVHLQ